MKYVNFSKENPHSKFMNGDYAIGNDKLNQASMAFQETNEKLSDDMVALKAMVDMKIGWNDAHGEPHTEYLYAGNSYLFPKEAVTDEPQFDVIDYKANWVKFANNEWNDDVTYVRDEGNDVFRFIAAIDAIKGDLTEENRFLLLETKIDLLEYVDTDDYLSINKEGKSPEEIAFEFMQKDYTSYFDGMSLNSVFTAEDKREFLENKMSEPIKAVEDALKEKKQVGRE